MSALERNPEVPASTTDEDLGLGIDWKGILRGLHNLHGDLTFLRQHEHVPEVPVVSREEPHVSHCNSRKGRRLSTPRNIKTFSEALSREKSHLPS